MATPLIVQPRRRSLGSSSSARDHPRSDRTEARHRLAEQPLVAVQPGVTRRDVVDAGVAEDMAHGVGRVDGVGGRTDDDAELALGIHGRSQRPIPGQPARSGDGGRGLAVDQRPGRPAGIRAGLARRPIVQPDRVDRARVRDGRSELHVSQRALGGCRLAIGPVPETREAVRPAGRDGADRRIELRVARRDRQAPIIDHDRDRRTAALDDRREAHGQARAEASASNGATAARMTSAMPPTPVQRSNAMAAWAISISEPFAARRPRARAACEEGRLGRDVDQVEHGRIRRQQLDRRWSPPDRACRRSSH